MKDEQTDHIDADPHFGTTEQMLKWCESFGITPTKDEDGFYDWHAAWEEYLQRPEID